VSEAQEKAVARLGLCERFAAPYRASFAFGPADIDRSQQRI
jgi:hypothetical protein